MKLLGALIVLISISHSHASEQELPDSISCLTYRMEQLIDAANGVTPTMKTWINRVVRVENNMLFWDQLTLPEFEKIETYYLSTIANDSSYIEYLAKFVDHICKPGMSDSEREWHKEQIKRDAGLAN